MLELAQVEGSEFPPIAWGGHFFCHSPSGEVPNGRLFAAIVTKDYSDDALSQLDPEGRWWVNLHVGSHRFAELIEVAAQDFDETSGSWRFESSMSESTWPASVSTYSSRLRPSAGL